MTFGAMPIAATVEGIPFMTALIALLKVAAEGRGAAQLDGGHDAPLRWGHRRAMSVSVGFAVAAKDISHFQLGAINGAAV